MGTVSEVCYPPTGNMHLKLTCEMVQDAALLFILLRLKGLKVVY